MLFQTLDDKNECISVFVDGEMHSEVPMSVSRTWSYSNYLSDYDIEYAQIYCQGKTLDEVCPDHLRDSWNKTSGKLKAFIRSFQISKVNLSENCFFDMVPVRFLHEYCAIRNKICGAVFSDFKKPDNYHHLVNAQKVLYDIKYRPMNLKMSNIRHFYHEKKARKLIEKYHNNEAYCSFNLFGSKTGRLATNPDSFPIHNLKREYRSIIEPTNDFFIELDYNAAEARVVLGLLGKPQPKEDIHDWHAKTIYRDLLSRDEAKTRFFAWLYNPESQDHLSNREYDRDLILERYYLDGSVNNIFNRNIECDDFHAFNYLIQSTCADIVLDKMYNIYELLKHHRSYITFSMHDSIIIDFAKEDKYLIKEIISEFKDTKLGSFKSSIKAGINYNNLKLINLN